jgi:hypothetical protein
MGWATWLHLSAQPGPPHGVFTVGGGFAAAVLSLLVGFQRTLAVGLLIYVAAAILFAGAQSGSTSR